MLPFSNFNALFKPAGGYLPPNGTIIETHPTMDAGITGLAFDMGRQETIAVSATSDEGLIYDSSFVVIDSFALGVSTPRGVAFNPLNDTIIVYNETSGDLSVYDRVLKTLLTTISGMPPNLRGLSFNADSGNLLSISSNSANPQIYIHDGVSSTILSSFPPPLGGAFSVPQGICFDGTNLITGNAFSDTSYVHEGITETTFRDWPDANVIDYTYNGNNLISLVGTTFRIHDKG